ncbi:hypothetical protein EV363DRAFT_1087628, partial [Boletus edulis]
MNRRLTTQSRTHHDETQSSNSNAAVPSQTWHHEEQTSNTQQVSRLLWALVVSFATVGTFQPPELCHYHIPFHSRSSSDLAAAWAGLTGCAWVFFLIGLISSLA